MDSLGYVHYHLGHHDQAITHYHQAIALFRESGDPYYEARALMKLGDAHHTIGNILTACDTWQQALTVLDDLGHPDADTVRAKLATVDTNDGDQL